MAFEFFYPLSEATSGTTPTTTADAGASGPDLTLDYGPGDMSWTSTAEGNGLNWTVATAQSSDARASATIGSALATAMNGITQGVLFVKHESFTSDSWSVAFSLESTGAVCIELQRNSSGLWTIIWQNISPGLNFYNGGSDVVAILFDTTQAANADRYKIYALDAGAIIQITPDTGYANNILTQNTALAVASDGTITIGNRGAVNRNGTGVIKAVGWENTLLSEATIEDYLIALDADDDTMPSAATPTSGVPRRSFNPGLISF